MIKTWNQRCQEHPDHQTGMVSHHMIALRMQEEIDELRAALAPPEQLVVGGDDLPTLTKWTPHQRKPLTEEEIELAYREIWRDLSDGFSHTSAEWIEAGIRYAEKVHGIE